jgi:hypothetical protein
LTKHIDFDPAQLISLHPPMLGPLPSMGSLACS